MNYEQLLDYMSIIIDLEKNLYIQNQTIEALQNDASRLAVKKKIREPYMEVEQADGSGAGLGVGVITAIIGFIVFIKTFGQMSIDNGEGSGIGVVFGIIFKSLLCAALIGLGIGGIVYGIVHSILSAKYKREAEESYKYQLNDYDKRMKKEKERLESETQKRNYINEQISALSEQRKKTEESLEEFYSYNIIDERYRHDLVALCTLYQYLKAGQTYTLRRDNQTGDKGAYNIYENAYLAGLVLKKLDDVIDKMDDIIQNQYEIVEAIREGNNKINQLESSIKNEGNRISRQINQGNHQRAAIQYNLEQNNNLIAYSNKLQQYRIINNR